MTKRLAKLKFVAGSGQYGLNFPATDYVDHGIRLIRTTDLVGGTLASNENGIFVPEHAVSSGDKLLPGDLLLSRSGTIGRAFLTPSEAEGMAFAGFLVRFRPGPEVETQYLFYCTQSNDFQFAVHSDAVSSTIQNFNADRYNNIKIPLPPLDEQRAIADYLDQETAQIDALVAKQDEFIGLLRERRTSLVSSEMLRSLGKPTPLRRIVDVIDCAHVTAEFVDGDERFPVASIRECQGEVVDLAKCKYTTAEFYGHLRASGRAPRVGDLLFIRNVSVGLVAAVAPGTRDFAVGQETVLLRRKAKVDSKYLRHALISAQVAHEIEGAMIGSTFRRINVAAIRSLSIPLPRLDEQIAIARRIDEATVKIDALIAKAEEHIALAKERRSALITAAVTGQFDVRTATKGTRV